MRTLRFLFSFLVLMGVFSAVSAQEPASPLLVLRNDGIEAVSPDTGQVTPLVAPPNGAVALRNHTHEPVTVFSAGWLSPDGQYLVYRTLAADALARVQQGAYSRDHALHVVDVHSGESVEIPLPGHEANDLSVWSVAWTGDGARLGVALYSRSRENEDDRSWSLAVYERDTWELALAAPLPAPAYATTRRLLAAGDSFALVENGIQGPHIRFFRLGADGEVAEPVEITDRLSSEVNLYIIAPFNPLHDGETWRYGLNRQLAGDLVAGVDLNSGDIMNYEAGLFPGMVSALSPDTSLRLTAGYYDGDAMSLLVRSAEGEMMSETPVFKAYAFGITGDNTGSTFALSPDGQTVAFLDEGVLHVWRDGELTALDVEAEALAWAPPRYQPVYDPAYLAG